MKFYNKFRFTLTRNMLLIGLLPLLFAIISSYMITSDIIREDVERENSVIVQGLQSTISEKMLSVESAMNILASTNYLQSMNPKELEHILLETVEGNNVISQIYIMDLTGMQIYKTSGELADRSDRDYFQKALTGKANYSEVLISGSTGLPIIVRALPIYRDNEIVGVLGASIELSFVSQMLQNIDMDEESYAYIVDKLGVVLAHPDDSLIKEKVSLVELEPVREVIQGKVGTANYIYENDEKFASYSYLELTEWGFIVQTPTRIAFASLNKMITLTFLILLLAIVIIGVGALLIAKSVNRPIKVIETQINKAKNGHLNIQMDSKTLARKDEFGLLANNFSDMIDTIRNLIKESKDLSIQVNDVSYQLSKMTEETRMLSNEITNAIEEIATGAGDQAEESEKSVLLTSSFNKKFKDLQERSSLMLKNVENVIEVNKSSKNKMESLDEASTVNTKTTSKVEKSISDLNEKSSSIAEILATITSISEQTNLLALNASIEAARAGEHGKGFAVVADEIRKLAEGSKTAADEINIIISSIQKDISNTVNLMKDVSESTKFQALSVDEVNKAFNVVDESVVNISINIDTINSYVHELSEDNIQIVDSISNISSVSEETAAASEEVTASVSQQLNSVEEVAEEAKKLQQLAEKLNIEIDKFDI